MKALNLMQNSLTLTTTATGCDVRLGNAGGAHGMALSFGDLIKLYDWLTEYREAGFIREPLTLTQKG